MVQRNSPPPKPDVTLRTPSFPPRPTVPQLIPPVPAGTPTDLPKPDVTKASPPDPSALPSTEWSEALMEAVRAAAAKKRRASDPENND